MITQQELQSAHNIISQCVIQTLFQHRDSFKKEVLGKQGWCHDEYSIERVHCANAYRITLKHEDFREKDLYIDSYDVYKWLIEDQRLLDFDIENKLF